MSKLTARRVLAGMSTVGLAAATFVTVASPAGAFSGGEEDVTATVASNVTTASPLVELEITRSESIVTGLQTTYSYEFEVLGIDAVRSDNCTLTLDGATIDEGACWSINGFFSDPLKQSGNYVFSTDSMMLASWTFTMPTDTPAPIAPAKCKITKVTQVPTPVGKSGPTVKVKTNGKCASGMWSYSYSTPEGLMGAGFGGAPEKGKWTIDSLEGKKNVTLTLGFSPSGRIADTVSKPVTLK